MVAPFLVPLRKWIAQQKRMDSSNPRRHRLVPSYGGEDLLTEEEPFTENESTVPATALHIQPTMAGLPGPSTLPASTLTRHDGSEHLQRMLGIGSSLKSSASPQITTSPDQSNLLLAMLHGAGNSNSGLKLMNRDLPHTPPVQIDHTPPPPASPMHVHPLHPDSTAHPPPIYPLASSDMLNNSVTKAISASGQELQQAQHISNQAFKAPFSPPTSSVAPLHDFRRTFAPNSNPPTNQYPSYTQNNISSPYQAPLMPSLPGLQAPVISSPPGEKPPLTNHSLGLLEMLKNGKVPPPPANVETPKALQNQHNLMKPVVQESISSPVETKPVSSHQSTLLDLFQKGSSQSLVSQPKGKESLPGTLLPSQTTSNVPDAEPTYRNIEKLEGLRRPYRPLSSNGRAKSPKPKTNIAPPNIAATTSKKAPQMTILARPSSVGTKQDAVEKKLSQTSSPVKQSWASSTGPIRPSNAAHNVPNPFQPQILQRPKQAIEPASQPPPPVNNQEEQAQDQKQILLSLFGQKSPAPPTPRGLGEETRDDKTPESSTPQNGSAKPPLGHPQLQSPSFFEKNEAAAVEVKNTPSPMTPQDRTFLLDYLHEVARGARR